MKTKLVILGGGIGAIEVRGIIDDINNIQGKYEIVGVLDDNPNLNGASIENIPVLGPLANAQTFKDVRFIFAIGSVKTQKLRSQLMEKTGLKAEKFETLIHPSALIDKTAKIGYGCVIHPRVTIGNNAVLGNFAIIAVASTLGPGVYIGDFAMITSHILLLSQANVGKSVFIGSMTCIVEGVTIGAMARIGVGSLVSRDIEANVVAMGNPLRKLGQNF